MCTHQTDNDWWTLPVRVPVINKTAKAVKLNFNATAKPQWIWIPLSQYRTVTDENGFEVQQIRKWLVNDKHLEDLF